MIGEVSGTVPKDAELPRNGDLAAQFGSLCRFAKSAEGSVESTKCFRLILGVEERNTPSDANRALIEVCSQSGLKIFLRIVQVVENASCVVGSHQFLRHEIVLDASPQDCGTEDHSPIFQRRLHVLEDNAFAFQGAGQTMQKVVETNGTKSGQSDINGLEHIAHVASRSVTAQPGSCFREAIRVEV